MFKWCSRGQKPAAWLDLADVASTPPPAWTVPCEKFTVALRRELRVQQFVAARAGLRTLAALRQLLAHCIAPVASSKVPLPLLAA
jgi:hypothetical protein